ncbi:DHA2 family efflux MFS transporter permease subunit [Flavobacterium oreochromis]|uniref:DHA2 family efflux MFS transporter permease subunit n=1 Tax=Flavobacterium oreochromis TaxID=2906078 RepID=UPI00385E1C08
MTQDTTNDLVEYGFRRVMVTIVAILCSLLEIVDTTIVNVALNEMKGSLGATLSDVSWVITAYAIANVIIIPMTNWLSQQFGRKNYFTASIIIFTITSFLCGNSTNIWELVFFRFIQGLGGGALLVTAQTIITESYPIKKRGMAQAIYGLGVILGPTFGPPLGGYIVDHFSWPFIFYINIPLGIIATVLAIMYVKSPKFSAKLKANQVDWLGIIYLSLFVGSLQYVLEHGQQDDWFNSNTIINLSIISLFGFIFFIHRELTYEFPIVNLKVLKYNSLQIGILFSTILGFGVYTTIFVIPVYTQSILRWNATQSGLLLIPSSLMTAFAMPFVGKLLQKEVSIKYLLIIGFSCFSIFAFWLYNILTPSTGEEHFWWPLILRGLGLGLLFVPVTSYSLSELTGKDIGDGAAFTGMLRQLGGSFGIAIVTTFISRWGQKHRANLVTHLDKTSFQTQNQIAMLQKSFIAKGYSYNDALNKAYQVLELKVIKQSSILAFMDIFMYLGILFVICIPIVIAIKTQKSNISAADAMH